MPTALQLDLFDDRYLPMVRATNALADGRFDEANHLLVGLELRYPDDPLVAREAARLRGLRLRLADAEIDDPGARVSVLASVLAETPPFIEASTVGRGIRIFLLRQLAGSLEATQGPAAEIDGRLPSELLLEAGAVADAVLVARRAASAMPDARRLAALGNAFLAHDEIPDARTAYRDALLLDPAPAVLERITDEPVRRLPDALRIDVGITVHALAWTAPCGAVIGLLPIRALDPDGWTRGDAALQAARSFLVALGHASAGTGSIAARREMKRLSPELFAFYMARLSGSLELE